MKSKIKITNVKNIDFENKSIIDSNLIETRVYDSDNDLLTFENQKSPDLEQRKDCLIRVSLYDDLIIENGEKYRILSMLSANSFS